MAYNTTEVNSLLPDSLSDEVKFIEVNEVIDLAVGINSFIHLVIGLRHVRDQVLRHFPTKKVFEGQKSLVRFCVSLFL